METQITSIQELLLIILLCVIVGVAVVLLFFVAQINRLSKQILAEKSGKPYEGFDMQKWWKKQLGVSVPVKDEVTLMLDHDYDGIKELDNHLPPWWLNMFYLTIVFGIVYILIYHVFDKAPLSGEEYTIAMEEAKKESEAYQAKMGANIDEKSVALKLDDQAGIANGKAIFDANCMACHGLAGEGTVGPNLTDDYWLHGGSISDIFKTIKYGIPEKGMISWQSTIKPKDMQDVANYILSLHGTNPPNAKAPEGELVEAGGAAADATATADSTAAE